VVEGSSDAADRRRHSVGVAAAGNKYPKRRRRLRKSGAGY